MTDASETALRHELWRRSMDITTLAREVIAYSNFGTLISDNHLIDVLGKLASISEIAYVLSEDTTNFMAELKARGGA